MAAPFLDDDVLIEVIQKFAIFYVSPGDWLPLRLVSRFFNHQILFTMFVMRRRVRRYLRPLDGIGCVDIWFPNKYSRLHDSWWLQRILIRSDPIVHREAPTQQEQWNACADEGAHIFVTYTELTKSNVLDAVYLTGLLGNINSLSVRFQKAKELICDAYACLLAAQNVYDDSYSDYHLGHNSNYHLDYLEPMCLFATCCISCVKRFQWTGIDIFFLTTCYLGQLSAFQHSLTLLKTQKKEPEDFERLQSAGLYVAIRQDSRSIIAFLLSSCFAMSLETWSCALAAATAVGNLEMVRTLLKPAFSMSKDEFQLQSSIMCATEYEDPTARLEMLKLLFGHAGGVSGWLRLDMLACASRFNDVALAKWVIESGPVDFYHEGIGRGSAGVRNHPLLIAVWHHRAEMVRFLLETKFEVHGQGDKLLTMIALKRAVRGQHLDTFKAIVPHVAHYSLRDLLCCAARIDHGVESVNTILDPIDLDAPGTERIGRSLGSLVVEQSLTRGTVGNLEWLLSRGYRISELVISKTSLRDVIPRLERAEELLRSFNNPALRIRCGYTCDRPKDLSELLQLPKPYIYTCGCGGPTT